MIQIVTILSHHLIKISIIIWLAPRAGQMNQIAAVIGRAGKVESSCPLGTTRCIPQAQFHQKPYNKSFIDQVCSVKMAGYWPSSFFACLWTETKSRSINSQKKNVTHNPYVLIRQCIENGWKLLPTFKARKKSYVFTEKEQTARAFLCFATYLYFVLCLLVQVRYRCK